MRLKLQIPTSVWQEQFVDSQKKVPYSYDFVGDTLKSFPKGFDHDRNKVLLGSGEACFAKAKEGIRTWAMFPKKWTAIFPKNTPIEANTSLGMTFNLLGIWWINSCRIVYTINENRRFGFAYGTLPEHIEKGEELFLVEMDNEGKVWYHIQAFSRPRHWLAKLGYLYARSQQRRFVRSSFEAMKQYCATI